jgi:hypothetical protein
MKIKLPDSVASPQDLTALLLELQDYGRWFTHESMKVRTNVTHPSQTQILTPAASALLRDWGSKKPLTSDTLDSLMDALQDFKKSASTITLTLAAPPTSGLKETLVAWCRANIAPTVLVTFQFNATLLGGMVVRYGSHIFDWSFKRQILAAREHFPEVLRRV